MTATTKAQKSIDYQEIGDEPRTGSSPYVIEFFKARDQMIADRNDNIVSFQYRAETKTIISRRELLLMTEV